MEKLSIGYPLKDGRINYYKTELLHITIEKRTSEYQRLGST